jgi:hypothetical protein
MAARRLLYDLLDRHRDEEDYVFTLNREQLLPLLSWCDHWRRCAQPDPEDVQARDIIRRAAALLSRPAAAEELGTRTYPNLKIHVPLRQYLERVLAGMFGRQPDMSGDQRKRLLPHELRRVEDTAQELLELLAKLAPETGRGA